MKHSILVFDGVCVLCSRWVQFVLRRDRHARYRFASMQGESGRRLLHEHGIDPNDPSTFLLLEDGVGYTDSDAIVRVLESFGRGWRFAARLIQLAPRPLRDALYRWVARRRYQLFGRRSTCMIPPADAAERFLG